MGKWRRSEQQHIERTGGGKGDARGVQSGGWTKSGGECPGKRYSGGWER